VLLDNSVKVAGPGRLQNLFGPVKVQTESIRFHRVKEDNKTGTMRGFRRTENEEKHFQNCHTINFSIQYF
jgi:hypothetical protein